MHAALHMGRAFSEHGGSMPSVRRPELVIRRAPRDAARRMAVATSALACAGLAAGCLPEETVIAAPIDAIVTSQLVMLDGVAVSARDAVPLPDGSLLIDGTAGDREVLVLAPGDGRSPVAIGDGGEVGAVRSVATTGAVTLVVGESGVLAIENGALFRVPIEPMLEAMEVRSLAPLPRADAPGELDFLIATDTGLFVVEDEAATPVLSSGEPLVVTHLAARPSVNDVSSAWAADDEGLVRITLAEDAGDPPTLSRLARLGEIEALASDDEGRPWWVEDGALYSLTRDQRVILRVLPMAAGLTPSGITSITTEGELWIHASDESGDRGALFHFDGHAFRAVSGAIDGMTIRCATGSECLGFDGTGEMARIAVRHDASIEGVLEGATLHEAASVSVVTDASERVSEVRADVSGTNVSIDGDTITIDPVAIGFGPRTLSVTIAWSDGTLPRTVRRSFVMEAPATWVDDIQPLYQAQCSDCHGAAGPSARRLDAREGWMREIDRILPAIQGGAMPLGRPRLPEASVALVRTWAAAGFPE